MVRSTLLILICLLMVGQTGCAPRTIVCKNPSDSDTGIRYYRPKPYLLVTPVQTIETNSKGVQTTTPGNSFVNLQLQYLPDFSEEYSISVRSGLGTNNTSIKLQDGWNLTEIGQNIDSQFDENVEAISGLVEAASGIIGTAAQTEIKMNNVAADSNVPIGYYESVIGRDQCGRKQLYGWRYIGFAPMQSCPLVIGGVECSDCESLLLYSLVFRNGKMVFVPLTNVPHYLELESTDSNGSGRLGTRGTKLDGNLDEWLRRELSQLKIADYRLDRQDGVATLVVFVAAAPNFEPAVIDGLEDSLASELGVGQGAVEILFQVR